MAEKKFIDDNGLAHFWLLLKGIFAKKELKTGSTTEYKVLSDNNYSTEEKEKLAGLNNYILPTASAETLGGVKVGAGLAIKNGVLSATGGGTADSVDWSNVQNKPTKVSDFANDSGFQTEGQVTTAISNAIANIQGISYSIVEALPTTGEAGVIYLISNSGANPNSYDEYIWIKDKFEKIGTTDIDLSGYVQETDLVAITNTEIDALFAEE